MWILSCILRCPTWLKNLPHCLHSKGFSPVWTLSWIFSCAFWLKHLSHCLHSNGFSPVWTLSWVLRFLAMLKHLPYSLHSWGFSPVWTLPWILSPWVYCTAENLMRLLVFKGHWSSTPGNVLCWGSLYQSFTTQII